MNKLFLMQLIGLKITWRLISLGLYGFDEMDPMLSIDEFYEYMDQFLYSSDEKADVVIELFLIEDDPAAIKQKLNELSQHENSDETIQKRKWFVAEIYTILDSKEQDYFQQILEIMEFWLAKASTVNCPCSFPSSNEEVEKFFTHDSLKSLIKTNKEWIANELLEIIRSESTECSLT